jgi:hypothetical protein
MNGLISTRAGGNPQWARSYLSAQWPLSDFQFTERAEVIGYHGVFPISLSYSVKSMKNTYERNIGIRPVRGERGRAAGRAMEGFREFTERLRENYKPLIDRRNFRSVIFSATERALSGVRTVRQNACDLVRERAPVAAGARGEVAADDAFDPAIGGAP